MSLLNDLQMETMIVLGAAVSLPIEAKKYMRNLVEQSIVQFFVAVKVRETKQLYLKVCTFDVDCYCYN